MLKSPTEDPAESWQLWGGQRARHADEHPVEVVWSGVAMSGPEQDRLLARAATGTRILLAGPTLERLDPTGALVEASGVLPGRVTPEHDVRVRRGTHPTVLSPPVGTHAELRDRVLLVDKVADDVEVLLEVAVGLERHPVATYRPSTGIGTWTLGADRDTPTYQRLLWGVLERMNERPAPPDVRVALLGYGAIGHEHTRAVAAVDGLALSLVCDRAPDRLDVARRVTPDARMTTDPEAVLADEDTDLVVISTPPNTHAAWALRALEAGKHVVIEKPFALTTTDADEVLNAAAAHDLLAVVYQNRRADPDQLALRRLVTAGTIGEVFHLEAFIGGYGHPCNYWHSDQTVSGGALYDWGAHVLDQILDLMPGPIEHVTAAEHKRAWHDVTNADHSRVTLRFAGGAEAEFVHSDLAAALKPRWYVLGTRGAVVGHWRAERVLSRSPIGTLAEDVLAPADAPPRLTLHHQDGSVTELATPPGPAYAFHQELADHLRTGLPMTVTGAQSRRVVSVLAAARESAGSGGHPARPR
jgi:predicted dehydrogenase